MSFPFWGNDRPEYCGYPGFEVDCQGSPNVTMNISSHTYRVLGVDNSAQVLTIVSQDYAQGPCPQDFYNVTLKMNVLNCTNNVQNVTLLYNCTTLKDITSDSTAFQFSCPVEYKAHDAYMFTSEGVDENVATNCGIKLLVPVLTSALQEFVNKATDIGGLLKQGFEVYWKIPGDQLCRDCKDSGGRCGYDTISNKTICFCKQGESVSGCPATDQTSDAPAPEASPSGRSELTTVIKAVIGVGVSLGLVGLLSIIFLVFLRQRKKDDPFDEKLMSQNGTSAYLRSKRTPGDPEHVEISLGIHLFTYDELEVATSYFADSNELGEGGFGTVYYGKLKDGREVAIKRLFENSSKWMKTYMNEVDILTHLRHKNLVTLYGCTSRRSRELLLVYEFVANGTVADHIHGKNKGSLAWPVRLNIAIETANALVYLHASDIIHRDVKTHNILLDENFQVKVADFGMSRLIPLDVTHVSTAPQGTPGYVDPEYHQCYHLTDKSDVYSFGVVLIELVSSLAPVDITRRRNEINLSNLAMNKIQSHELHDIVDASLGFESDYKVNREVRAVAELAFQCLQSAREMRPTMEEILDTLVSIQSDYGKKGEAADIFDIPADDAVSMKGDLSSPVSPMTQKSGTTDLSSSV